MLKCILIIVNFKVERRKTNLSKKKDSLYNKYEFSQKIKDKKTRLLDKFKQIFKYMKN